MPKQKDFSSIPWAQLEANVTDLTLFENFGSKPKFFNDFKPDIGYVSVSNMWELVVIFLSINPSIEWQFYKYKPKPDFTPAEYNINSTIDKIKPESLKGLPLEYTSHMIGVIEEHRM